MSTPIILNGPPVSILPPGDPIDIDPNVPYSYVIPAENYTTLGFEPSQNEDFAVSLDGRTLTVEYTGLLLETPTIFSITVFASSVAGTVQQTLNFRVSAQAINYFPSLNVGGVLAGSTGGYGQWETDGKVCGLTIDLAGVVGSGDMHIIGGTAPNAVFAVGDRIFAFSGALVNAGSNEDTNDLYVYEVSSTVVKFSRDDDSGGNPYIGPGGTDGDPYYSRVQLYCAVAGRDTLWVTDTSNLAVGDSVEFFIDETLLNSNTLEYVTTHLSAYLKGYDPSGNDNHLFVKEIVDSRHIKVAATSGGAAITSAVDFPSGFFGQLFPFGYFGLAPRLYPNITSDAEVSAAVDETVDYTITADIDTDDLLALGLPDGLSLADGEITGTPSEGGFFPVVLIAIKGAFSYLRYLIFNIGLRYGRDVYLDVSTGAVYPDASLTQTFLSLKELSNIAIDANGPPLIMSLGDAPMVIHIVNGQIKPGMSDPGELNFTAKLAKVPTVGGSSAYYDGDEVVAGTTEISDAPGPGSQVLTLSGEDWTTGPGPLFTADQDNLQLLGQFEWRNGDDPTGVYRISQLIKIQVNDTVFR